MKSINIAAIVIIGLVFISDENEKIELPEVCVPVVIEPGEEVAVVQNEPIADTFSRPRKPCPPGGPGRR